MADNSSRENVHDQDEVLGTINASFDVKNLSLEGDARQLNSHAMLDKQQEPKVKQPYYFKKLLLITNGENHKRNTK